MKGIYTALITPFDTNGEIDQKAFENIIADQVDAGVDGIIPCGTTGESPTLSKEEKKRLIQIALSLVKGTPVKVLAGTGSNDTHDTVSLSKWASEQGVAGVLVVTPYYNKPSQSGLIEHFLSVAREVSCEVMVYNVPSRTGVSLTSSSIATLAADPKITSLKEATGNVAFTSEILDALEKSGKNIINKFDILAGDDMTFLPLLSVGAVGIVSVASNLFPRAMIAIKRAFDEGRPLAALDIHKKYYPLFRDLFLDSNPVPIKYAMSLSGFGGPFVRKPLVDMNDENKTQLRSSLQSCGIQKGSQV